MCIKLERDMEKRTGGGIRAKIFFKDDPETKQMVQGQCTFFYLLTFKLNKWFMVTFTFSIQVTWSVHVILEPGFAKWGTKML